MLKGMTGYGRASAVTPFGEIAVEIASVNRRHLDLSFATPPALAYLVPRLRDLLSAKIGRGQVKVTLSFRPAEEYALRMEPNLALIDQVTQVSRTIAEQCGIDRERAFSLAWQQCGELPLLLVQEEACDCDLADQVIAVVDSALLPFLEMRTREGEAIGQEMDDYLAIIEEAAGKIKGLAPTLTIKYRDRLKEQIERLLEQPIDEGDEQLAKQVVLFAAKSDIAEELSRIELHTGQLRRHLKEGSAKPIEFLLQEVLRETNTIGSKASDGEIALLLVEMKSSLERMREQMHNVE